MSLDLQDYPDPERRVDERRAFWYTRSPSPRRGEENVQIGWFKFLLPLVLAALVSYFTAVGRIGQIEERERNHYEEILRVLATIQGDVRAIRSKS